MKRIVHSTEAAASIAGCMEGGPCLVYGHKAPDLDAVASSVAYASLMRSLGYDCDARLAGAANRESELAGSIFGFSLPPVQTFVPRGSRLILTDHSEYAQSVDGAREASIIQMIDHHAPGDIDRDAVPFVRTAPVGASSTLVWELFSETGTELDRQTAGLLLSGILSDTHKLSKQGTGPRDIRAFGALSSMLGLGGREIDGIFTRLREASRDYAGMSDAEVFLHDCKSYEMCGRKMRVASMDWDSPSGTDEFIDRMLGAMAALAEDGEMLFAKVDLGTGGCCVLYSGDDAGTVAGRAFGAPVREGVCFSEKKLNRKLHIVPMLAAAMQETI